MNSYGKWWLVIGIGMFAMSSATIVAWQFGWHPSLGTPIAKAWRIDIYAPWDTAVWWWQWREHSAFMSVFRDGLQHAFIGSALAAMLGLHITRTFGPLDRVDQADQPDRFGTTDELRRSHRISAREGGVVLGQERGNVLYHTGDDHVLLMGASRVAEKGVSHVLPTLVDTPESVVVFDPKGELYEATADERSKFGPVWLWDPTRPGTHRFNPLLELRGGSLNIGDCRALALLMLSDLHGKDPFWPRKAGDLCAGLLRAACLSHECTLTHVRTLALEVGAGKKLPHVKDTFAREMIDSHLAMDHKPRSGVDAQLQVALAFAGDPSIQRATEASEFRVSDLCAGKRAGTVYLTLPASQAESLQQLARVSLQALLLGMLHSHKNASNGARKTRRTLWVLDEFPALGHLPFIEHGMALAAGYGLKLFLVCQDLAQIKRTYGTQQSIMANAGTVLWSPGFSEDTTRDMCALTGTIIANMRARHRKVGVMDRPSETASQSRHPTLNPREAMMMARDHTLLMHHGCKPMWMEKARWYTLPQYDGRIRSTEVVLAP